MNINVTTSDRTVVSIGGVPLLAPILEKVGFLNGPNYGDVTRPEICRFPQIPLHDILKTLVVNLAAGLHHFTDEAVLLKDREFYSSALGINVRLPSASTLEQRLKGVSLDMLPVIYRGNIQMLRENGVEIGTVRNGMVPMDLDVTTLDNSNTFKECVSFTYQGYNGFAPMMVFLGPEGVLIDAELREGSQHSQKGTLPLLERNLKTAEELTGGKTILTRMDSGHDSAENMALQHYRFPNSRYLIKWNPRMKPEKLRDYVLEVISKCENIKEGSKCGLRDGKKIYYGSITKTVKATGYGPAFDSRMVYEVIERTITATGQVLLEPDYEVSMWWTNLSQREASDEDVKDLYHDHATMEQYHSFLKDDMDIERLPCKSFKANTIFFALAVLSYNALRIISGEVLKEEKRIRPGKKKYPRRRHKTILQKLIWIPGVLSSHARSTKLDLGKSTHWTTVYKGVYRSMCNRNKRISSAA